MDENNQDTTSLESDEDDQAESQSEPRTEVSVNEAETNVASAAPGVDNSDEDEQTTPESNDKPTKRRKKKRAPNKEAAERRFLGRHALCKRIEDLAPHMLKTVKLRILGQFLDSTKGLDDLELANRIRKDARKLSDKKRLVDLVNTIDPDVNRRNLKEIIIHAVLLQEEAYSLEERRLEEKVIEFEKAIVKRARTLDFFDPKRHDPIRWHHYDTYRIVLEAAWRNDDDISYDEAALLRVLRDHLNISREEHWLIGAYIKRFPKNKCAIHTPDEIHEARKQLQKESVLWSYRDQNNRNIDVLPVEVVSVIRQEIAQLELQHTNYRRMLQHDSIRLGDLRAVLKSRELDHSGNKPELVERIINGDVKPSAVLDELDKTKVSTMCSHVGLKSSGNKPDLIERLITFYDDLTFEERETKDERETAYNNYELLATRSYADLRAKKFISKDLEIEHQFEKATDFLIEVMLKVKIDVSRRVTQADGRIPLDEKRVMLWDCKSAEKPVDLQDYLDDQFDGYMRKEAEKGTQPLAFMVIAPSFTPQSIKLAHRYKARTNWDIALIQADALKYLAEQWNAMEPEKPFPINLLNRTEIIDRERVEFLISLA